MMLPGVEMTVVVRAKPEEGKQFISLLFVKNHHQDQSSSILRALL